MFLRYPANVAATLSGRKHRAKIAPHGGWQVNALRTPRQSLPDFKLSRTARAVRSVSAWRLVVPTR